MRKNKKISITKNNIESTMNELFEDNIDYIKNDKNERGNLKIKFEIIYPNRILVPEEIIAITDIFKKYDLK